MMQSKQIPLDYDVVLPRLIPLVIDDKQDEGGFYTHYSPRYLGRYDHVPLFGEYAPKRFEFENEINESWSNWDFIKDSYTLRELVSYFEKFVVLVVKTTKLLREPGLQEWERKTLIDTFYSDEQADWGREPSSHDNYYYAQSIPELRAVEVALFFLSSPDYPWHMDITKVRQRVDDLKLQLWQCLPDFYNAHEHPIPQPVSYQPNSPYPLFHIADDFISGLRPTSPIWIDLDSAEVEKRYLLKEFENIRMNKLSFKLEEGKLSTDVLIEDRTGKRFWIDTQSYIADYVGLVEFIEDILMCKDPARYSYDSEGPISQFVTAAAYRLDLIKFAIYLNWNEDENYISGFFDRQQLITDLVALCDLIVEYSYELRHESRLRTPILRRLSKIKSIM